MYKIQYCFCLSFANLLFIIVQWFAFNSSAKFIKLNKDDCKEQVNLDRVHVQVFIDMKIRSIKIGLMVNGIKLLYTLLFYFYEYIIANQKVK